MYPNYMVTLTALVGLAIVRRLMVDNRIGPKAVWILLCLYISKLSTLFMPSEAVLWVSAVLLLAVSPSLLLYKYLLDLFDCHDYQFCIMSQVKHLNYFVGTTQEQTQR